MPNNWDPVEYRERAEEWRKVAEALQPGPTRDAYLELAAGYEKLAGLIAKELESQIGEISAWTEGEEAAPASGGELSRRRA